MYEADGKTKLSSRRKCDIHGVEIMESRIWEEVVVEEPNRERIMWCGAKMCLYFISGVLSQRNNATLSSPTPSFTSILNLPTATVRHSSPVTRFFGRRSNHPYLHADSALPVVTSVYIGRLSTRVFHLSDNLHV